MLKCSGKIQVGEGEEGEGVEGTKDKGMEGSKRKIK